MNKTTLFLRGLRYTNVLSKLNHHYHLAHAQEIEHYWGQIRLQWGRKRKRIHLKLGKQPWGPTSKLSSLRLHAVVIVFNHPLIGACLVKEVKLELGRRHGFTQPAAAGPGRGPPRRRACSTTRPPWGACVWCLPAGEGGCGCWARTSGWGTPPARRTSGAPSPRPPCREAWTWNNKGPGQGELLLYWTARCGAVPVCGR